MKIVTSFFKQLFLLLFIKQHVQASTNTKHTSLTAEEFRYQVSELKKKFDQEIAEILLDKNKERRLIIYSDNDYRRTRCTLPDVIKRVYDYYLIQKGYEVAREVETDLANNPVCVNFIVKF